MSCPVPKTFTLHGVEIIGDFRDVIPLQKRLQVQVRDGRNWKTVAEVKDASTKDITVPFSVPVTTSGLRIFVPAADLPQSGEPGIDGIVRICELLAIAADGKAVPLTDVVQGK